MHNIMVKDIKIGDLIYIKKDQVIPWIVYFFTH